MSLIQDLVPGTMRGVSSSLISFFATLIGFTLGPLLVGLATVHLFGYPDLVGYAITTTVIPAIIGAALLFLRAHAVGARQLGVTD